MAPPASLDALASGGLPSEAVDAYLRAAAQPAPTGNGPEVLPVVLQFLTDRQEQGRKKYGTALRAHNGRSALRDAKEEAADQLMYLTQLEMEWPALVAQVRADALEEALQLVKLASGAEVGKTAEGALGRLEGALRGLMGLPPPEPVRAGPRKGKPRMRPRPHDWALASREGEPRRWECLACPVTKHEEAGPRGGTVYVFRVGGEEIARGSPPKVHPPPCPPPKGGG